MRDFRYKLAGFMYGRYGIDKLYYAAIVAWAVLFIIKIFVRSAIIGIIIDILIYALIIWSMFRAFSKNIYKRNAENQKFLNVWNKIKSKYKFTIRRFKDIKTHRYRKCPYCKAALRLPKKVGKHSTTCPRCHNDFFVRVLF